MTINFITNDEFRNMNVGLDLSKYDETTLSGVITRATAKVEDYLDYSLPYEENITEKTEGIINNNNDLVFYPSKYPLRSVSSATVVKGDYSGVLTITGNYDISSREREVVFAGRSISLATVSLLDLTALRVEDFYLQVVYSAGYYMYDRPEVLKEAVSLYANDEIARAMNRGGGSEIRQGAVTIKYSSSEGKSDYVEDAETLLLTLKRTTGW